MLTREGCLTRRQRLWNQLPADIEWVLVADPRHVQYLANFWVEPLSFSAGERAWLLLERCGKATLLGDNFTLRSRTAEPYIDDEIVIRWYDHQHSVINRDHALLQACSQISDRLYGRPGVVEAEWLPLGAFEKLGLDQEYHSVSKESAHLARREPVDLGTLLRMLRRQKEPDELALIQRCCRAAEAGHAAARQVLRAGIREWEVFREVQAAVITAAERAVVVYGDFRACPASHPKQGGLPTDYRLQPGDLFVLDYSVVIAGYRCDFTNTLCVGQPTAEQQQLYSAVMEAITAGESCLKAGTAAREVFTAVHAALAQHDLALYFGHHAGHGLGLAHPEPPILVPDSRDVLLEGDVITLEPGVYVPGVGGLRNEHNYVITATGYERLSQHVISLV
ncbi:MAG: aminopeptidase [Planctomycetaceae bacterium]|nr:MAG: aminopeptidase [Planctomycetaceae bacterium]